MNRRNFLSKSSLALLAAAGLPKAIAKQANTKIIYKSYLKPNVADQTGYELQLDHLGFTYLSTAKDDEKIVVVKINHYNTTDLTKPDKTAEFNYIVQTASESQIDGKLTWTITTKFDKLVSGDNQLGKKLSKEMKLTGIKYNWFKIHDRKGNEVANLSYYSTPSTGDDDYGDCFLTTACVQHRQLADDCDELNTLRFLRDNYMKQDTEGALLVADYKTIGPKIIDTINGFDNKAEIYNYMFEHLVEPSVKMIKEKRYAEATAYYKDFVVGLTKKYL
ncbi:hypothetical protein ACQ33O_07705 [Ferruginibacter sp. SUN002]|uniref:hypothetical protein n=1 Tax=Ferruginibacter sp. SUN002 TaxID=2937789 RepID=UPI003D360445